MLNHVPNKTTLYNWLDFICEDDSRLQTHHIGEYYTFLIGKNYKNTKKGFSEYFKKWYEYYQGTKPKQFIPLKTWINEYAKTNDYVVQYYIDSFAYAVTLFTKEEWYVRKG